MTCRSSYALLLAALLLSVGVAAACGPYQPSNSPAAPQATQSPWGTPAQPPPPCQSTSPLPPLPQNATSIGYPSCSAQSVLSPASTGPGWVLSVTDGKLHLQTAEGTCSTCEKLTMLVTGIAPITVAVSDKLIRLGSGKEEGRSSDFLQASAQKVSRTGPNGATLVLEGNARLLYVRNGRRIDVSTELLSVNLSSGQVISEMNPAKPARPTQPNCCKGSAPLPCTPTQATWTLPVTY
jgi:hypothetical protein